MAAPHCGVLGSFVAGTHTVAQVKDWNMDITNEVITVPKFGDTGLSKQVCGPYDWKGTANAYWDMDDTLGQKVLHDALIAGTTVSAKFYINATQYYSGTIYITAASPSVSAEPGNVGTIAFNYEGSGTLSMTLS